MTTAKKIKQVLQYVSVLCEKRDALDTSRVARYLLHWFGSKANICYWPLFHKRVCVSNKHYRIEADGFIVDFKLSGIIPSEKGGIFSDAAAIESAILYWTNGIVEEPILDAKVFQLITTASDPVEQVNR